MKVEEDFEFIQDEPEKVDKKEEEEKEQEKKEKVEEVILEDLDGFDFGEVEAAASENVLDPMRATRRIRKRGQN